jgi:hypothetical protein
MKKYNGLVFAKRKRGAALYRGFSFAGGLVFGVLDGSRMNADSYKTDAGRTAIRQWRHGMLDTPGEEPDMGMGG